MLPIELGHAHQACHLLTVGLSNLTPWAHQEGQSLRDHRLSVVISKCFKNVSLIIDETQDEVIICQCVRTTSARDEMIL
ncbi:hypothetical protein BgiMline_002790, partial [Biomphalaria glabrata]